MLTLGSTDVDHNLIHVGVTGAPLLFWDETQDQFSINKGIDVTAGTITFDEVAHGAIGTTETIDWTAGQKHSVTLDENTTLTFTAPAGPCNLLLKFLQDGTGTNTVTFPTVRWPNGGGAPTISAGANDVDIVSFYYDGTSYFGVVSQDFV